MKNHEDTKSTKHRKPLMNTEAHGTEIGGQRSVTRTFVCRNCDPEGKNGTMNGSQIKEHLHAVHGISSTKGRCEGIQFLDGTDFFSNTFEWTFECEVGQVVLYENSTGTR